MPYLELLTYLCAFNIERSVPEIDLFIETCMVFVKSYVYGKL